MRGDGGLMTPHFRSAEEMFSLFIAIAFTVESIRAIHTSILNLLIVALIFLF